MGVAKTFKEESELRSRRRNVAQVVAGKFAMQHPYSSVVVAHKPLIKTHTDQLNNILVLTVNPKLDKKVDFNRPIEKAEAAKKMFNSYRAEK